MSHKKALMMVGTLAVLIAVMGGALSFRAQPASAAPQQQAGESPRTITVTGYGSAFGAPDIVMLGLGVEVVNADIVAAMDETTARMNAVMDALKAGGVAAEDIRTDHYSIYQDYGYNPASTGEMGQPQYRVSVGVTVIVRQTETVGELLASAVQAGANMVNYLQFDIEDRAGLEAEARDLAVADAQSRASLLAAALGLSVGEPLTITEGGNVYGPPIGLGGGGAAYAESAAISQGTLRVDMQVTITFALQ
ncbi:MAG: SIMPL domain-containing protein [Anaerolineae bacterium]|nr:SIMPL domain-containing protein [Anaerolineae bacterium]MEB2289377.1 SIMPL domain-containing protein [Anaerolineae bacterium]